MVFASHDLEGTRVLALAPEGTPLQTERDAVDVITLAAEHRAGLIAIPAERLGDDFFR